MTQSKQYGGNQVRRFEGLLEPESHSEDIHTTLASGIYRYEAIRLGPGQRVPRVGISAAAIWCCQGQASVIAGEQSEVVAQEQAALVEHEGYELVNNTQEPAVLLVAGVAEPTASPEFQGVRVLGLDGLKRVEKPWGEELWINGRHPGFAFKRIRLNAGHRTSLQYHEFKRETNLLVEGTAKLHYNETAGEHAGPVREVELSSIAAIDVSPPVLHRIEAVTDVLLFEVSTPHLDDVIRVSDDAQRPDGFIATEHKPQPQGSSSAEAAA